MKVLQHYYTSYANTQNRRMGFQLKAMSSGISSEMQSTIIGLVTYCIPPILNEYALETHPISLRYFYNGPHECIFLCSQSSGNDENGRPGNFFAHTVVTEPDVFREIPPIFYWQSPFWRKEDPEKRSSIISLPDLPVFDAEVSLDINKLWSFLAQGGRRELLYKLMSAVVHSSKTQRRIVILDSTKNVVWWIAAVSCLLPPDYRPLLSFATYHHDPYQGQFLITGATKDSLFRASAEEYMSYFVLNAETGVTSEVEASPYAQLAAECAQPDPYEAKLLSLFTDYIQRFPKPTVINEQLDLAALYARIQVEPPNGSLTVDELRAIDITLSALEQSPALSQEELNELRRLRPILWEVCRAQENPAIHREYKRVVLLLSKYEVSTKVCLLDELKYCTEGLMHEEGETLAIECLARLHRDSSVGSIATIMNQPEYLQWLPQFLERLTTQQLCIFWQYLGREMQPGELSRDPLVSSLREMGSLLREKRTEEKIALVSAMLDAMKGRELAWLQLAVNSSSSFPAPVLKEFYYSLVQPLRLNQRIPYRKIILPACGAILKYEIASDVYNSVIKISAARALTEMDRWARHAELCGYEIKPLLIGGFNQLRKSISSQEWSKLASRILMNDRFVNLLPELEDQLVPLALSGVSLNAFSILDRDLYVRYQLHPSLSAESKTILACILAIMRGHMDYTLAVLVQQHVSMLLPQNYRATIRLCVPEFFKHTVTSRSHQNFISAFFTWKHGYDTATYFWRIYWGTFTDLGNDPLTMELAVEMLAFWFKISPAEFRQLYVVQHVLLMLPSILKDLQKRRGFRRVAQQFVSLAMQHTWYPSVKGFFSGRKKAHITSGRDLLAQLQRHHANPPLYREEEVQVGEVDMTRIFAEGWVLDNHKLLAQLYTRLPHAQFWSCYWKNFANALSSYDADSVLALLSFWFDESFQIFGRVPYLPQDFFLGLSQVLTTARKESKFREASYQINKQALQQGTKLNKWYRLVASFFANRGVFPD